MTRESTSTEQGQAVPAEPDPRLKALVERGRRGGTLLARASAPDGGHAFGIIGRRLATTESLAGTTLEAARRVLGSPVEIRSRMDALERVFHDRTNRLDSDVPVSLRQEVLTVGERVLTEFANQGVRPTGSGPERVAMEALIALHGRPALRAVNGFLDLAAPEVGDWQTAIEIGRDQICEVLPSVGRINFDGYHIGTGFVIALGVVVTNRHVVEEIAVPIPTPRDPASWAMASDSVTVNFSDSGEVPGHAFRIKGVLFTGPDPIDRKVDFRLLDLALLEVETTNRAGGSLPKPLALSAATGKGRTALRRELFVVGYPARPVVPSDDFDGTSRAAVVETLRQIFGLRYGIKYFSPGVVSAGVGSDANDVNGRVFCHDATTLGGNSGSSVLYFGDPMATVGLHFAGDWMRANFAHALASLQPALAGTGVLGAAVWE